jgi:hypothetical protein
MTFWRFSKADMNIGDFVSAVMGGNLPFIRPGLNGEVVPFPDLQSLFEPSFAAVLSKVEGEDALEALGALEHLRMAQGADGVVVAGTPVVLHA